MRLKAKFGAFIAAAVVTCAIGVAPAQASSYALPSPGDLSGVCAKATNAKLDALCSKGVEAYNACSKQTSSKGLTACLVSAAKGIVGSGSPIVGGNKGDLLNKLKSLAGGKLSGLNLQGVNISTLLGKLGGSGGINLNSLMSKFGR